MPLLIQKRQLLMPNEFRTRMVSFRLSEEEYERLHQLCYAQGVRSVSDLARAGIKLLLQQPDRVAPETLESRVTEIESRLRILSLELRRVNQHGSPAADPPLQTGAEAGSSGESEAKRGSDLQSPTETGSSLESDGEDG